MLYVEACIVMDNDHTMNSNRKVFLTGEGSGDVFQSEHPSNVEKQVAATDHTQLTSDACAGCFIFHRAQLPAYFTHC
jgi:hypothetical protein